MHHDGLIHDQLSTSLQGLYSMCIVCGYALRILFSPRKNHVTNRPIRKKKTMINILSASRLLYIYIPKLLMGFVNQLLIGGLHLLPNTSIV